MWKSCKQYLNQHEYDLTFAFCSFFWNFWAIIHKDYDNLEPFLRNTVTFFIFYFAIRCFISHVPQRLPIYILGGLTVCKVLQLLHIHELFGLDNSVLFLIFFEPDFHILDIPNYAVVCLAIYIFTIIQKKNEDNVLFYTILLILDAIFLLCAPLLMEHVKYISPEKTEKFFSGALFYGIVAIAFVSFIIYYVYAEKIIAKSPALQDYLSEQYRKKCNQLYDTTKAYKNMFTEIRFHSVFKYYCIFLCCLIMLVPFRKLFAMHANSVFDGNILFGTLVIVTTFVIISVLAVMFHRRITYFREALHKSTYSEHDIAQDYMKGTSTALYLGILNIGPTYTIFASHMKAFIVSNKDIVEVKKIYSEIDIHAKNGTYVIREGNASEQAVALRLFQRYSINVVNENPYKHY